MVVFSIGLALITFCIGVKVGWEISGVAIQLTEDDPYVDEDEADQQAVERMMV